MNNSDNQEVVWTLKQSVVLRQLVQLCCHLGNEYETSTA